MNDIKLTMRRRGRLGQYVLCDESGNVLPNQLSVDLQQASNELPCIVIKFHADGKSIRFVEDEQ